jgi:catechol 2,3-dioxygenase-like lactoylglutathione lyase family enzyme
MNRFHVHLNVRDLPASIRFYSELFAAQPALVRPDYAKWMLEDPRVNFAISTVGREPGIDHLGIQVDSSEELAQLGQRLQAAGGALMPEEATVCCYARSDKNWTEDPQGTRWETFHTFGEATTYYAADAACATDGAACSPDPKQAKPMAARSSESCCAPASGCC